MADVEDTNKKIEELIETVTKQQKEIDKLNENMKKLKADISDMYFQDQFFYDETRFL